MLKGIMPKITATQSSGMAWNMDGQKYTCFSGWLFGFSFIWGSSLSRKINFEPNPPTLLPRPNPMWSLSVTKRSACPGSSLCRDFPWWPVPSATKLVLLRATQAKPMCGHTLTCGHTHVHTQQLSFPIPEKLQSSQDVFK